MSAAAGEHYSPPGTPNWDALERTLDVELPQKKDKRRRGLIWFFLLPGLLLTGAAVYWFARPAAPAGPATPKGAAVSVAPATGSRQLTEDKSKANQPVTDNTSAKNASGPSGTAVEAPANTTTTNNNASNAGKPVNEKLSPANNNGANNNSLTINKQNTAVNHRPATGKDVALNNPLSGSDNSST
ncbi:MAG: hypothetical protein JST39_15280, partial [Bacteroidetes bacterium]|nr:hypothetical protein [Bacteroidota bacterium]